MNLAPLNLPFIATAALVCVVISMVVCRYFMANTFLQNEVTRRSSHVRATSRAGGLAIICGLMVGVILSYLALPEIFNPQIFGVIGLTILAGGLGFLDDAGKLNVTTKLSGQLALGLATAFFIGPVNTIPLPYWGEIELGFIGYILTTLWVVSFINVFNFMDGLNGIAAGTCLVALIVFATISLWAGQLATLFVCVLMIAAISGFAFFNFTSGRIFMGDAGSHGLGMFVSGLAILGENPLPNQDHIGFVVIPIIFVPFIMDVAITLWRRASVGEALYIAHKEHYYQRLNQRGMTHLNVAKIYAISALISAMVAVVVLHLPPEQQWLGPFFLVCFFSALLSHTFSTAE